MAIAPDLRGAALDGRYELEELIGEGAFGRVYRGRDRRLERAVAIKVVKPWWAEDPEWVAVFEREARLLARVNHPGIVQIHDVGHCADGLYYVSELVDGEDLAARLRRAGGAGLDPREARALTLGLCDALAGAHHAGIVHRDVKPANVLIARGSAPGRPSLVKVADFGVAHLAESTEDGASLIVGTPRYMAPEQADGGRVSPATDVYAIGAILFEMLAGRPPFDGRTAVELAVRHREDPLPPLPAHVDPDLAHVVRTALAKAPAERFADAGEMGRALRTRRAGGGGSAQDTRVAPLRSPRSLANPSARRRSIALLGLVGLILAALVAVVLLTGGPGGPQRPRHTARARASAVVEVPLFVGESAGAARSRLRALGLRARVRTVPAPGIRPGTVTRQSPVGGHTAAAGGIVALSVAEVPRWRPVTTITSRGAPAFRILGERFRLLVSASGTRHCTLLVFCSSARLRVLSGAAVLRTVSLSDEVNAPTVVSSGPGRYRVTVDPASASTRWSIRVEDDF